MIIYKILVYLVIFLETAMENFFEYLNKNGYEERNRMVQRIIKHVQGDMNSMDILHTHSNGQSCYRFANDNMENWYRGYMLARYCAEHGDYLGEAYMNLNNKKKYMVERRITTNPEKIMLHLVCVTDVTDTFVVVETHLFDSFIMLSKGE